jgi:transitional endoplasmic reticulum ATPase
MQGDQAIQALRDALRVTPHNIPLRTHLARSLASLGRLDEAEQEFRAALADAPDDVAVRLGLADCYHRQGKTGQALVVVETLVNRNDAPAEANVLYARLLIGEGQIADAVARYQLALELDPAVEDPELSAQLGVGPQDQAGEVFEGRVRQGWQGPSSREFETDIERPQLTFSNVGGMDAIKEEIAMKIIFPMKHPEMYQAYGKTIGGGILMYGPPGCGKTYLARATAGEISAGFLSIGISDVLDMWIGSSERNLRELFEQARANTPCVLFFDEVDALGGRRSDMVGGSSRQIINQFLAEMDGVDRSNEGVLILAATNAPWHVDPAFRRPGRFDRVLFVPPPDRAARAEILRLHCQGKPQGAIDHAALAAKTEHFSGADLKAVVDAAVEEKLRQAIKSGRPEPLTTSDLTRAAKSLRPTTREWFATARNYALYSNQGGTYDDVLEYLKLK